MLNFNLEFDCHIHHYGKSVDLLKNTINNSKHKSKYMCYSCINYDSVKNENRINTNTTYFMVPFVLKETDICQANNELLSFTQGHNNIIQFPLLGDNLETYNKFDSFGGLKEHFLLHDICDYDDRIKYYEFLNSKKGILLLHCKDSQRLEYVKMLRKKSPEMYIQIAHLGVNRKNISETKKILKEFQNDSHVFYDVSTVFDFEFITSVFPMVKKQLLFGTDFPYIQNTEYDKQVEFYSKHTEFINCMSKNARSILQQIKN